MISYYVAKSYFLKSNRCLTYSIVLELGYSYYREKFESKVSLLFKRAKRAIIIPYEIFYHGQGTRDLVWRTIIRSQGFMKLEENNIKNVNILIRLVFKIVITINSYRQLSYPGL